MKVKCIAECLGAFCNTFNLHWAIIGLGNQFSVFLRVAVLHRFYCISSDEQALAKQATNGVNGGERVNTVNVSYMNSSEIGERSGSVECLTRDLRAGGSSLTGVTVLWSLSKTH